MKSRVRVLISFFFFFFEINDICVNRDCRLVNLSGHMQSRINPDLSMGVGFRGAPHSEIHSPNHQRGVAL